MTNHRSFNPQQMMSDYANLRTVPAVLGILFALATLYQFNGISEVHIVWFDYTLTTAHGVGASLAVYFVAFASSETKSFDHYEDWEKVTIGAGPILVVGNEYFPYIPDLVSYHTPGTEVVAFLIVVASYGVAVR